MRAGGLAAAAAWVVRIRPAAGLPALGCPVSPGPTRTSALVSPVFAPVLPVSLQGKLVLPGTMLRAGPPGVRQNWKCENGYLG